MDQNHSGYGRDGGGGGGGGGGGAGNVYKHTAKHFFELGEAFAYSQITFHPVRFQSKVYGGEFERSCFDIVEEFKRVKGLFIGRERLDAHQLSRDMVKLNMEIHRLESRVLSAYNISKNTGYDVTG